jgi:magnesium and cobalt transporter
MPDSTSRGPNQGLGSPTSPGEPPLKAPAATQDPPAHGGFWRGLMRKLRRRDRNEAVREAIEELIEETPESDTPISDDQLVLLANILKLRDKTVRDVMVPRVDIIGIAADTPIDAVVRIIQTEAHSRYPVYRESLDDVIGMIHIKDVHAYWGTAKKFNLRDILRRVVFVAPTMPVLDMLLDMRRQRTHMALVVDEFGGTDGLLTIEDLVEEIVGEIEERGEVVTHPSGVEFEILQVDPRRIRRLRVRPPASSPPAP